MIKKQIKQELLKARTVSLFLILFIALASALCANAVDLFYSLNHTSLYHIPEASPAVANDKNLLPYILHQYIYSVVCPEDL